MSGGGGRMPCDAIYLPPEILVEVANRDLFCTPTPKRVSTLRGHFQI